MGCLSLVLFPLIFFVVHPERIFLAAVFLCLVFLLFHWMQRRAWPVLGAAAAWGLWVPWEAYCASGGFDIRIDLLVVGPAVLAATAWGLIAGFTPRSSQEG